MIEVHDSRVAERFKAQVMSEWNSRAGGFAGGFFIAEVWGDTSAYSDMVYDAQGKTSFDGKSMSDRAVTLLTDVPDDIDPDRATRAAAVATYRVSDQTWRIWVAFGEEADEWQFNPATSHQLAAKVNPL